MPLFALPLAPSSTSQHSRPPNTRVHFSNLTLRSSPRKKRKRRSTEHSSSSDNDNDNASLHESVSGSLAAASTNPLSLTPDEVIQYRLAGLELDQELPAVKGFPHRALPERVLLQKDKNLGWKGKGKARSRNLVEDNGDRETAAEEDLDAQLNEDEEVEVQGKKAQSGPRLRLQHLSVLTTILQRCLLEGDIQRATRAWALLIRAQVSGRGIDLRGTGYWGIGAELLIRSLDRKKKYSYDSDTEEGSDEEGSAEEERGKRWGSAEGLEKAKDYYERLILQHPYKRQFHGSISALDFWPAMVGCEIYGIQFEQKEGLRKIETEEENDDGGERSGSQSEASEEEDEKEGGADAAFAADQRRKSKRLRRRAERRWIEKDEVRQTALLASEKIAARLDELMVTPPYSDSHNLLRLRGMLALYVGDLSVPAMPMEDNEDDQDSREHRRSLRLGGNDTEKRFLFRQRVSDHERGKTKREEEQERARNLFSRIAREGGEISDIKFPSLGQDEGQEEMNDAEE